MATHKRPSVTLATLGLGRSSVDLTLVVVSLAATALAVLLNGPTIVRVPLALMMVFFVPGYALTVALFPEGESSLTAGLGDSKRVEGITLLDRVVISVGLSLCTVVLSGLLIDSLPTALSAASVLGALVAVTIVAVWIAAYRRRTVPPGRQYAPFVPATTDGGSGRSSSRTMTALRLALAVSLLFAGVALIHSAGAANDQGGVTELYVESGAGDGAFGGEDYPIDLMTGERRNLTLGIGNEEGESLEYTLVGQVQRVDRTNATLAVEDREEILNEQVPVAAGESGTLNTSITPTATGEYRLVYLLYNGDVPEEPRLSNADGEIHLWIDVDDAAATGS